MGRKVLFVLVDALNYETAFSAMGFLNLMVEKGSASLIQVDTELPTLSRPLYETVLTGVDCLIHGICTNQTVRLSSQKSVFQRCREQGRTTGAAAYYWISELYNQAPFDCMKHREQHDTEADIQTGKFYFDDSYPDSHVFADGEVIRRAMNPDFLFIHPMGVDFVGHAYGSSTKEYRQKVIEIDMMLAGLIPHWIDDGYDVVVSADHGMDALGLHNGVEATERTVPLFVISDSVNAGYHKKRMSQLQIAPLLCWLLGVEKSDEMLSFDLDVFHEG